MPSKAVAQRDDGSIEISGSTLEEIANALVTGGEITVPYTDPEEASRAITMRILDSQGDDAFMPTGGAISGRDIVGVPLEVHPPLRAFPSTFEGDGPNFFFVFDAVRMDTGQAIVVSTGARNVLAALVVGLQQNRFPELPVKFWEPKAKTRRGFTPLWLVKADYEPEEVDDTPVDEEAVAELEA